jgi:hypothetical protein
MSALAPYQKFLFPILWLDIGLLRPFKGTRNKPIKLKLKPIRIKRILNDLNLSLTNAILKSLGVILFRIQR